MTERERLIDLLNDVIDLPCDGEIISDIADHLLGNGIILPLCRIGDKVYVIVDEIEPFGGAYIKEVVVEEISSHRLWGDSYYWDFDEVFFDRTDAESALEKLKGGGG